MAQVPNALTILRLALIPVFVVLMLGSDEGYSWPAAIVFAVAGVTDQVDGWLARRWHVESQFGKIADPLADRLMIDAAVIMLWLEDRLPLAALAVVLARDLLLVGGYKLVVNRGYDFEVNLLGLNFGISPAGLKLPIIGNIGPRALPVTREPAQRAGTGEAASGL